MKKKLIAISSISLLIGTTLGIFLYKKRKHKVDYTVTKFYAGGDKPYLVTRKPNYVTYKIYEDEFGDEFVNKVFIWKYDGKKFINNKNKIVSDARSKLGDSFYYIGTSGSDTVYLRNETLKEDYKIIKIKGEN